jgi:Holliday junction resolvasome RuvABC endonuclease subunit
MLAILGVDPGTKTVGLALINGNAAPLKLLQPPETIEFAGDLSDRLAQWSRVYEKILEQALPGIVAVENPMVSRNMRTVDALARFVGITVALAHRRQLLVLEYRSAQHRLLSVGEGFRSMRYLPERRKAYERLKRQFLTFPSFKKIDEHQLDAISLAVAARREYERRD